jgi:hypothetical protein
MVQTPKEISDILKSVSNAFYVSNSKELYGLLFILDRRNPEENIRYSLL